MIKLVALCYSNVDFGPICKSGDPSHPADTRAQDDMSRVGHIVTTFTGRTAQRLCCLFAGCLFA